MKQHRLSSVIAGIALLLGTAPMTIVYKGLVDWFFPIVLTTVLVIGASIGARALRLNAALQVVAMFLSLLFALTWQFSNGGAILGLLPGPGTFANFDFLMGEAAKDIREQALPVDATAALVFLLVVGIGAMAVLTEVFTSIMRIPALAGIPLLLLYLIPMALMTDRIPWILFVPGALGYLWLLLTDNIDRVRRYGRRFSGDGRGIDRWEPSPLAGTGRWLGVLVVGLALLVPALVPGVNSNMLAGFGTGGNNPGGNSDGGSKAVSPWAMLEGGLDKPTPQKLGVVTTATEHDPGYMKMWTASKLTSSGFGPNTQVGNEAYPASQGLEPEDPDRVESNVYNATFRSTGLEDKALPLYNYATDVEVPNDWKYDPVSDTVTAVSETTKDLEYDFTYTSLKFTPDDLRSALPVPESSQEYRYNTGRPQIESVDKLTGELTNDEDNQYDKVRAIYDHFSIDNGFSYTLETEAQQDASDIEAFLDNKEGYCQQYAAAMGWMVREAGIPARVSIGLTTGTKTERGYEVGSDNFHAWVEVYFQGFGWVPFDPTPASGVSGSTASEWAPDPDDNGDDDSSDDSDNSDNDESDSGDTAPDKSNRPDSSGGATQVTLAAKMPPPIWPYWLTGGVLAAVLVLTPGIARAGIRRRRLAVPQSRPAEAAQAAWRELCDSVTDLRIPLDESETSRALSQRLISETGIDGPAAAGVKHLAAAQEQSCYAPRPPTGLTLREASRAARFGLAASRSRLSQLRADFAPASMLTSWALGIRQGLSVVSNGSARLLMYLNRLIPRRRSAAPKK